MVTVVAAPARGAPFAPDAAGIDGAWAPALAGVVGADVGLRCVLALQLAAALSLLGFGPAPPAPDWAAMLRENLPGVTLNPAALVAPAAALAALTLLVAALGHAAATRGRSR